MVLKTEVIKGVFDPRNYKVSYCYISKVHIQNKIVFQKDDPNWAKRRKSEYLAFPGVIKYTRERTYDDLEDQQDEKQEVEEEKCREIKINIVKNKAGSEKILINPKREDIWPRRKRTDITELYH